MVNIVKYDVLLYEIGLYIVKRGKIQIAVKNRYNRVCSVSLNDISRKV